MPKARGWAIGGLVLALVMAAPGPAWARGERLERPGRAGDPAITIYPNEPTGPPLMGLGVEWDPYDTFAPTWSDWERTFSRLAYMQPGFLRVVEPASDYFQGYDAAHNPIYRWGSPHLRQLQRILSFAQSRGIKVVLGDWGDPLINGDPRIPADFVAELRDVYGFTNVEYYDPMNEPNYSGCAFSCWRQVMRTLRNEFKQLGLNGQVSLIGPSNGNSWDDTSRAQALDRTVGLDRDNPVTDVWVTKTVRTMASLIGAYDSHRYGTIWGIEHGVYENQMRSRREEITNLDAPAKAYFEGELGMTARTVNPFSRKMSRQQRAELIDPSAHAVVSPFIDSQPHIRQFIYGVWMADAAIQAIAGGLSGASAWDLDDAMHVGGGYGPQNLKQWGFWNSFGGTDGYPRSDLNLRPWYYTWSLLSRSFPAGSQALTVPGTDVPGLRVAAAKIPYGTDSSFSFAVVNDAGAARTLKLTVPFLDGPLTLDRYDYFKSDRPVGPGGLPVPARVLTDVVLSRGLRIHLPSRGVVILSSLPAASAAPVGGGGATLLDDLSRWGMQYQRSRGLRLDRSDPLYFNGDPSRATPWRKGGQYLVYRADGITNFELKVYGSPTPGIRVYRSPTGQAWARVPLVSTTPAPALKGHGWYLDELLPAQPLPAGIDQLRIEFTDRRTELSQVSIQYG